MPLKTFPHRPELEGLRAVAILSVLAHHSLNRFAPGGFLGVDVFFVLSGYLITGILQAELGRTGDVSLRYFYLRRLLRLGPSLVLVVGVYLAVASVLPRIDEVRSRGTAAALVLGYLANWVTAFGHFPLGALEHAWSLANEEQFYLLWPPLLWGLARAGLSRRAQVSLVLGMAAASTVWRLLLQAHGASAERVYYGFDTRLEGLLFGCALALVGTATLSARGTQAMRWVGHLGGVALVGVFLRGNPRSDFMRGPGFGLVALAAAAFLGGLLNAPETSPLRRLLSTRGMRYVGRISYALYLWHQPVNFVVRAYPGLSSAVALGLRGGGALALAALTHALLEVPLERFRRGLRPPPSAQREVASTLTAMASPPSS